MRRDPIAWTIAALGLLALGLLVLWVSGAGDPELTYRFTSSVSLPADLIAICLAFRVGHSGRFEPGTRRAWTLIGVAVSAYVVGAFGNYLVLAFSGPVVLLVATAVVGVAAYPTAVWAITTLPRISQSKSATFIYILDVAIVAWSAAILLWHFAWIHIADAAGTDLGTAVVAAIYPVGDLAAVFAVVAVVFRGVRPSSLAALAFIGVAMSLLLAGDGIAGFETLRGAFVQGGAKGLLYSGAGIAMAMAAYVQWRPRPPTLGPGARFGPGYRFAWLPYVAVAVAFTAPGIQDWNDINLLRQHLPATGLLIALVSTRLGVTAWQNARLAAAERGRLASAVDQAAEAMLMTDLSGSVTYANPAFEKITGFTRADVIGQNPRFLRQGASAPERLEELALAAANGEVWQGRLRYRRKDGADVEVDVAISPLRDDTGVAIGSIEAARDISRERALEAQLAQSQRMEAVGRLAGGIAHDFNNVLTAISGFSELAAAQVGADAPVAEDIAEIRNATGRATTLTRSLLAFSRRQVMQPTVLDLNDVVTAIAPMLARLIREDVELVVRLEPSLGHTLADRGQFEQVIVNLVVNAGDAMPEGGRLTIETSNTDSSQERAQTHVGSTPGPCVMLAVSDTGVGMTAETLERAFEPFYTTKGPGKGTGLGLSTVIGIVQQSGGSLDVESRPGHGTRFRIYLPRVDAPSEAEVIVAVTRAAQPGDETILVAEDEPALRRLIDRVLREAGYRVVTAANGNEALELAGALQRIDLLFTDMVMPGLGGTELAATLGATHPEMRVLYASGYTEDTLLLGAVSAASVEYMPKPYSADGVLARIRQILDSPVSGPEPH
jgi:PAS domain S-box-containing protein